MRMRRRLGNDAGEGRFAGGRVSPSASSSRRRSRFAFAGALTALMFGTFFSFGGLSYAVTGTANTANTVKKVATGQKLVIHHSSASDQYKHAPKPKKKQVFTPPTIPASQGPASTPLQSGTLPFTGLSLAGTMIVSGLLLLLGITLRRRERRS